MRSPILGVLARTVTRVAPSSTRFVLVLDGVDIPIRGNDFTESRSAKADEAFTSEEQIAIHQISIPTAGLPRLPRAEDIVRIGGRDLRVDTVLDLGTVVRLTLRSWRA